MCGVSCIGWVTDTSLDILPCKRFHGQDVAMRGADAAVTAGPLVSGGDPMSLCDDTWRVEGGLLQILHLNLCLLELFLMKTYKRVNEAQDRAEISGAF